MNTAISNRVELNGAAVHTEDLPALAQLSYGHFTSMQACEGGVRGLGLHLERLQHGTQELFGCELDREQVRNHLRHAIDGDMRPLSLRVNVFARSLDRSHMTAVVVPDILVTVSAAAKATAPALRLKSFEYTRDLPALKHVGIFPLFHYRRLAQQAGFDDALFVDADGFVGEASVWNIGFNDGHGIVWPHAPQLDGVSRQLLQRGMARKNVPGITRPVHLNDARRFRAAFLTNSSTAVQPVARIDDAELTIDDTLTALMLECHDTHPWETV